MKVLENIGVKKIDTDGKDFNVDYHEAIAMVPGMGDDKKGKIIRLRANRLYLKR